MHFCLQIFITL